MRLIAANLLLFGCSASERIASNASAIQREAKDLSAIGRDSGDMRVISHSETIYGLAADIHSELPKVEDQIPAWMSMMGLGFLALIVVAVAFILWNTGIGTAIRVAIGWIPRRKVREAEMAADMLSDASSENPREFIASKRGSDPMFDAAFKKAWSKRKAQTDAC